MWPTPWEKGLLCFLSSIYGVFLFIYSFIFYWQPQFHGPRFSITGIHTYKQGVQCRQMYGEKEKGHTSQRCANSNCLWVPAVWRASPLSDPNLLDDFVPHTWAQAYSGLSELSSVPGQAQGLPRGGYLKAGSLPIKPLMASTRCEPRVTGGGD
jgi:hypothetical protein